MAVSPAFNAFVKIGTITGESTDSAHSGWIDVLSFSWGLTRPSSKAVLEDFGFVMPSGRADPLLQQACSKGTNLGVVELSVRAPAGKSDIVNLQLESCTISAFRTSGDILMREHTCEVSLKHKSATLKGG